jgi:hypothetical protein
MKGIYLTEQGKQEIEAKIAELESVNKVEIENKWEVKAGITFGCILMLNEILSSATILPVEENWVDLDNKAFEEEFKFHQHLYNSRKYPNGVVIQPKQ